MKSLKTILLSLSFFFCCALTFAQSTMTDSQIMDYIVKENAKGTPRSQIVTQLMERGVTVDRIQKIRRNYERQKKKEVQGAVNISGVKDGTEARLRKNNGEEREDPKKNNKDFPTKNKVKVDEKTLTPHQRKLHREQQEFDLDESLNFILPDSLEMYEKEMLTVSQKKKVFGRDIFNSKKLTFEPEMNIAAPSDYRLGPGDAVYVDVWGASQKQFEATVSPEGVINLEGYGPVNVNGLTVAQANQRLRNTLGSRFGGSQIKLTVGQTRTITVNVMGEVKNPGTYTVSAFATVFHALYMAGGVNDIGTLRGIKVLRKGRLVSTVDIYDYILNGRLSGNIRLTSDDVIYVATKTLSNCAVLCSVQENTKWMATFQLFASSLKQQGDSLKKQCPLVASSIAIVPIVRSKSKTSTLDSFFNTKKPICRCRMKTPCSYPLLKIATKN